MSKYRVIFNPSAEKEFARLEKQDQARILKATAKLEDNPRPAGCKKLKGSPNWRFRAGDFRVIYEVVERTVQINIVKVGHRSTVYDR